MKKRKKIDRKGRVKLRRKKNVIILAFGRIIQDTIKVLQTISSSVNKD